MNYIIIDFEYNQPYNFAKNAPAAPNAGCPFEIVQIGAVKLNHKLEIVGKRNYYVKPQLYRRIHPYVAKMTGFTRETFYEARTFAQVFKPLSRFIGRDKAVFCTWGGSDMREFYRNALYYKCKHRKLSKKFIDIQKLVSRQLVDGVNLMGLKNAVEAMGIAKTLPFHDALSDALYASELFLRVMPSELCAQRVDIAKIKAKTKKVKR